MKKLIFTAFAVVLFSTVSKANIVKETQNDNNINVEALSYVDCNSWAIDWCERTIGWNNTNPVTSHNYYRQVVEFCEGLQIQYLEPIEAEFIEIEGGRIEDIQP